MCGPLVGGSVAMNPPTLTARRNPHKRHAPWFVVDFNDQKRGRLNLIRHLLDHLPDHAVPEQRVELPPLAGKPRKESYAGPVKPIPNRY